jgi:hypothetical protein
MTYLEPLIEERLWRSSKILEREVEIRLKQTESVILNTLYSQLSRPQPQFRTVVEGDSCYLEVSMDGGIYWDRLTADIRGTTGAAGINGVDGEDGADGADGEDGHSVTVGNIFMSAGFLYITLDGVPHNAGYVKGDTGPQGPQGIQGPIGPAGATYYYYYCPN